MSKQIQPSASFITAWGSNVQGQLICDGKIIETPTLLNVAIHPFSLCSGQFHTLILSESLEIYSCGGNDYGQLGNGSKPSSYSKLQVIKQLAGHKIEAVACGGCSSFALTTSGSLYSWGLNIKGQLGIGGNKEAFLPQHATVSNNISPHIDINSTFELSTPVRKKASLKITIGDRGDEGTSQRSLSLTKKGNTLSKTQDTDNTLSSIKSVNIEFKVAQIACGELHSLILTSTALISI
jgi:alpha-tubulin suppressor-like RCC1 family protein